MITNLTRRFERRPLAKPNFAYYLWRFGANGVRTWRSLLDRPAFADTPAIARELRESGIVVAQADSLLSGAGARALAAARAELLAASSSETVQSIVTGAVPAKGKKVFRVDLVPHAIPADSPVLKAALDEKLLEIVAAYLGMWPCLHSIGGWVNYPTSTPPTSSQLWHHDPEDLKLIKVFIYLNDVGEENGPFTYIPGTHPFGVHVATAERRKKKERLLDEQLTDVFPSSQWRVCTGPANTMILADTLGYHRGGKPIAGTRTLLTFTYTSGTPLVQPSIWLEKVPAWISSGIQRYAVRHLGTSPPVRPEKKKQQPVEQRG